MEDEILQYANTLFAEGRHYVPVLYLCSQKFPDVEENKIFNLVTNLKNDIDRIYIESIRAMGEGVGKGNWLALKSE